MSDLPEPLIASNVDLRSFTFMPLDVVRLRDSDIAAIVSAEAFRAAVLLWCAAWHQIPASSIPSDDVSLARLAGFGRDVAGWLAVKEEALRGFVLCRDRKLYHGVIAEKAKAAWSAKLAQKAKTEAATAARKAKYDARQRDEQRDVDRDDARYVHQGRGEERKGEKIDTSSLRSEVRSLAPAVDRSTCAELPKPTEGSVLKARRHLYPTDAFATWYGRFPRKKARPVAEKAFRKIEAADDTPFAALLAGIDGFWRENPDVAFWPHPATWLNQRRWTDEPSATSRPSGTLGTEERINFGGGVSWPVPKVLRTIDEWRANPASWPEGALGAPPGRPGCKVPADVLRMAA